jgi:hypothetical protein
MTWFPQSITNTACPKAKSRDHYAQTDLAAPKTNAAVDVRQMFNRDLHTQRIDIFAKTTSPCSCPPKLFNWKDLTSVSRRRRNVEDDVNKTLEAGDPCSSGIFYLGMMWHWMVDCRVSEIGTLMVRGMRCSEANK